MISDFDFDSSIGGSRTVSFDTGYSFDASLGYDSATGCRSKASWVTSTPICPTATSTTIPLLATGTASITYGMINA